jgi:hypothetical protein
LIAKILIASSTLDDVLYTSVAYSPDLPVEFTIESDKKDLLWKYYSLEGLEPSELLPSA